MTATDPLKSPHYRWRRLRARLFNGVAMVVIGLAVVVGVTRLLLPHIGEFKPDLERYLSAELNAEVEIGSMHAAWPGLVPTLTLDDVTVVPNTGSALSLDTVVFEINWLRMFHSRRAPLEVILVGPSVSLNETAAGQWQVAWMTDADDPGGVSDVETPSRDSVPNLPEWLGVSIRAASLNLEPINQAPIGLYVAEANFAKRGDEYRLSGWLAAGANDKEQVQFRLLMVQQQARWVRAQAWLNAQEISLDYWLRETGVTDQIDVETELTLEAWLTWDEQTGGRIDSSWALTGPHGVVEGEGAIERWPSEEEPSTQRAWAGELFQLDFNGQSVVSSLAWSQHSSLQSLRVEFVDFASLHRALDPWLRPDARWPSMLSGYAEEIVFVGDLDNHFHQANGVIKDLAVAIDQSNFSLQGLDATLTRSGDRLRVVPDGQPQLIWPDVLKGEIKVDQVEGEIFFSPQQVEFREIQVESPSVSAGLNGSIYATSERPFLDVLIEAPRIEGVDVRPYLPHNIIPPPAMAWLNQALVWIGQANGSALLHFPPGLRTREFDSGHLSADVYFSDLELNYLNEWPRATEVAGHASFLGAGLRAQVDSAQVDDWNLRSPLIEIERFDEGVLTLDLVGPSVDAQSLSSTLGALPLEGWSEVFNALAFSGDVDASVDLMVPLAEPELWSIEGLVAFSGNEFQLPDIDVSVTELSGAIEINRDSIRGKELSALLGSQAVPLETSIGFGEGAETLVTTELDPGVWLRDRGLGQGWSSRLEGQTDVSIKMSRWPETGALSVEVSSDLVGMAMELPAPLAKADDDAWPLQVQWIGQSEASQWLVSFNDQWTMALQPHESAWAVSVTSDPEQLPIPPMRPGLEFVGEIGELDVGAWQALLVADTPSREESVPTLNEWVTQVFGDQVWLQASVERLSLPGVVPGQATLSVELVDQRWVLDVSGEQIQGEISLPRDLQSRQSVVVDLEHLYLLISEPEPEETPVSSPSLSDPRESFPLTLLIESLYWGELELGITRVETHLASEGIEIELMDIDGPDLRLQARGRWVNVSDGSPQSVMTGRLSSRNFNKLIQATGYQAGLQARQATLDFDLNWPGTPLDFNLFRIEGGLDFVLRGGNIPQASAGAGRLLGLVSFSALPRRLMLDFRDVFSSGFQFDGIEGRFDISEGEAKTDGIKIASPAAVITLTGTTDMIARTYDQSILVEPGLGSTLPVIGGLAGGPVGAAAGLLLRSLFDQPLKGVSEARYSITGPWSEPIIELVDARIAPEAPVEPLSESMPDDGSQDNESEQGTQPPPPVELPEPPPQG